MTATFKAVCDTNRKRIRGLWQRGEEFYLQMRLLMGAMLRKASMEVPLFEAKV